MEDFFVVMSIPAIVLIVYWVINLLKYIVGEKENFLRGIPLIASFLGAVLGVILFYTEPSMIMAENIIYAMILGGASGLAATGSNQVLKQLGKFKEDVTAQKASNDVVDKDKKDTGTNK